MKLDGEDGTENRNVLQDLLAEVRAVKEAHEISQAKLAIELRDSYKALQDSMHRRLDRLDSKQSSFIEGLRSQQRHPRGPAGEHNRDNKVSVRGGDGKVDKSNVLQVTSAASKALSYNKASSCEPRSGLQQHVFSHSSVCATNDNSAMAIENFRSACARKGFNIDHPQSIFSGLSLHTYLNIKRPR